MSNLGDHLEAPCGMGWSWVGGEKGCTEGFYLYSGTGYPKCQGWDCPQQFSNIVYRRITGRAFKIQIPWTLSPDIFIQLGLVQGPKISILTSTPGTHTMENTSFEIFIFFNLNLEDLCLFNFFCSCGDSVYMCMCFLIQEFSPQDTSSRTLLNCREYTQG